MRKLTRYELINLLLAVLMLIIATASLAVAAYGLMI